MIFKRFLEEYRITREVQGEKPILNDRMASSGIQELPLGVYNNGIYTFVTRAEATVLNELAARVFSLTAGKVTVYAVDWMGRLFASNANFLDSAGSSTMFCLDFADATSFTTEVDFETFHNRTAVDMKRELFNLDQYDDWIAHGPAPSDAESCIGYKIPLFLGGKDCRENMELTDRAVYLHLQAELSLATKNISGS